MPSRRLWRLDAPLVVPYTGTCSASFFVDLSLIVKVKFSHVRACMCAHVINLGTLFHEAFSA